jgi:putative intracellular protease/amidase
LKPSDIAPLDYVAIFFVGGHGPMFDMSDNTEIQQLTAKIYEANNTNIVAAVCHGPIGLVNVKLSSGEYLVKDKEVTGFSNSEEEAVKLVEQMPCLLEDKMKERGAKYSAAANWAANVKADGRVVTGQNPASATPIGEEIVKLLKQQ